jgi:murein DD-endopeptidase MepM/ murein hydrolase activator NlpD
MYELDSIDTADAAHLIRDSADTTPITDLWVYDGVLDKIPTLPNHSSVQVRNTTDNPPIPIAAGDLIGHLGTYERYEQEISTHADREQVHIETFFAKDSLKTFIQTTCRDSLNPSSPTDTAAIKRILGRILKIEGGALLCRFAESDTSLPSGIGLRPATDSPKNGILIKLERGTFTTGAAAAFGSLANTTQRFSTGGGYLYKAYNSNAGGAETNSIGANDFIALSAADRANYSHRKVFTPGGVFVWVYRSWYEVWLRGTGVGDNKYGIVELPHAHSEAWASFPLAQGQSEEIDTVPFDRIMNISCQAAWGGVLDIAVDDQGRRWWKVSTGYSVSTLQEGEVTAQTGWVCEEGHDKVSLCTSWDWPKFQILRDTTEPGDFQLMRLENNYAQNVPPGLKTYFDLIDRDRNGALDLSEIHAAWQDFNQVQTLSRFILQHWSEWGLGMDKWNTLDTYFDKEVTDSNGNKHDFKDIWKKEKKRIERMRFWESVQGQVGFPTDIELDHVHPLALIENFGSFKHPDVRWPLVSNRIRSGEEVFTEALKNLFGWVRNTTSAHYMKAHQGWDIYADPGTECYAIADGVVVSTATQTGYGNCVVIKLNSITINGDPVFAFYAHLDSSKVNKGNGVRKGDVIGLTGGSGNADPQFWQQPPPDYPVDFHLHFELRAAASPGTGPLTDRYNPAYLFGMPPLTTAVIDPV